MTGHQAISAAGDLADTHFSITHELDSKAPPTITMISSGMIISSSMINSVCIIGIIITTITVITIAIIIIIIISLALSLSVSLLLVSPRAATSRAESLDFGGFGSSELLSLRGGIPRFLGDVPEVETQILLLLDSWFAGEP